MASTVMGRFQGIIEQNCLQQRGQAPGNEKGALLLGTHPLIKQAALWHAQMQLKSNSFLQNWLPQDFLSKIIVWKSVVNWLQII